MRKVGIIGAGFSGTLTAINLIHKSSDPFELILINKGDNMSKGIAYQPYSKSLLLNVTTAKMSAFPHEPNHFLDWVLDQGEYSNIERELLANSFLSRALYGEYLASLWEKAKKIAVEKKIQVQEIIDSAHDLNTIDDKCLVYLENQKAIEVDDCILATGNLLPGNPVIENTAFFESTNYFQNPWEKASVIDANKPFPVLLIGNGLTMIDSVLGLIENGYKGSIYTISPNGFHILPHRHGNLKYQQLTEEMEGKTSLNDLARLVIRHIKLVRRFGISAEPIIDSLRGKSQKIWMGLSLDEKKRFMSKYRHYWGIARHRIPMQIHDKISQLKFEEKLKIRAGKIINIEERDNIILVSYFDKIQKENKKILVSRVINCTGPESNITKSSSSLLKNCLRKGIISQDELNLGINADPSFYNVLNSKGEKLENVFTLGSNLRGELWESTAVNELRSQADTLADFILSKHKKQTHSMVK